MVNLSTEMAQLWASLGPPRAGAGRVVQFVAATRGEGTSTVAREFALFAAVRSDRPVWLVDLDLIGPSQHAALAADPARFGPLGPAAAASPDGSAFFTVQPPRRDKQAKRIPDAQYLSVHHAGRSRLWVTRFRREMIHGGQVARVVPSGDYWAALRRHAAVVVVDSPSADHSGAAATIAPFVDCTVLVVAADGGDTRAPAALRDAIEQAGGRCAGIVFNRARIAPPRFMKAILR
jgi:Mrp family chromosome partitioning ATPase